MESIFQKAYDRAEFLNFLRRDFLPDDFLQQDERVEFATKTTYSKRATKLGVCKSLDLVVYEIVHTGKEDPRVGLSKEAFRMLAEEWQDRALVLFIPENNPSNYRFSLIEIKLEGTETSAKLTRKYSNPRRYSFVLGEEAKVRTPQEYLVRKGKVKDWEDLQKRFSVEVLTKEFYAELSDWYAWAIGNVTFPGEEGETEEKRVEHRSKNVIRLLTRLLFVWFLKQKHLIPWELFDEEYLSNNVLKDFTPNKADNLYNFKSLESRYYKAILQNLFFATLNCPIVQQSAEDQRERGFRKSDWYGQGFGQDHLMRYEALFSNPTKFLELVNQRVPFLNGGLFDCLDDKQNKVYIDGFSDNLIKPNQLIVPDFLFFGEVQGKGQDLSEFYGDKKKKSSDVNGLIDILKRYNFTIEENTPFDQEVSLDPELLGKVFENLLASYNPETKTTARKQTGSFYTPREIVQYMVDESLVAHLKRTVGEELESEYRRLMQYTDEELCLTAEQQRAIIQSLQNCKVLDPACGSGAFPVGVLQQMVHILSQLDPNNEVWKNLILDESVKELGTTLRDCTAEERNEIQEDINRNFDDSINRPDYARKLYLIENCIYGVDIQSIAVQISKLRFFISLVVDQKPTQDRNDNFGIRPLPNLEAKFVAANTLVGLNKGERTLFDDREIDKLQEKLVQASHRIFGAKSNKTKNTHKARVEELQAQIADRLEFLGVVGNDDARLMRQWRMFDQNASSPFFDPEWMFGVSDGFDIVIGNPPYINIKNQDAKTKETLANLTFSKGADIYVGFIEIGYRLLADKGALCLIIPNKFFGAGYGKNIRRHIKDSKQIRSIWDLKDKDVFENAAISTIVYLSINHDGDCSTSIKTDDNFVIADCVFDNNNKIQIESSDSEKGFLNDLEERCVKLSYIADVRTGVMGFEYWKMEDIIHSSGVPSDDMVPIYTNGNLSRYCDKWDSTEITLYKDKYLSPVVELNTSYLNQNTISLFRHKPKIIVRGVSKCVSGIIDNRGAGLLVAVHSIIPKRHNINAILGILNSKFINWYHLKTFYSQRIPQGSLKYPVEFFSTLPIPEIPKNSESELSKLVDKILEAKKANPTADTTALEAQIDFLVYKLYDLTYEEVLTIDPQTPITQQQYENKN